MNIIFFVGFVAMCGVGLGVLSVWLAARGRRQSLDAMLVIKPPRPYVDADGRSDYRPELRDRYLDGRR